MVSFVQNALQLKKNAIEIWAMCFFLLVCVCVCGGGVGGGLVVLR